MSQWLHRENCNKRMYARRAIWMTWDLTLQDIVLAKIRGCSREYVRQIRVRLGKPQAVFHGKHVRRTNRVIAKKLGCTPGDVGNHRYRHGMFKPGRGTAGVAARRQGSEQRGRVGSG